MPSMAVHAGRIGPPRVLVLELLCGAPGRGWYERLVKLPNFFGVMTQAVAVWAEEMGCRVAYRTYTGNERVRHLLSGDWDIAIISAYTRAAYAAYAISHQLRASGVVTALGGPHAVAYPEDSARHFDYVLGITDRDTVARLINERRSAGKAAGVRLASPRSPARLPGLRRRRTFLEAAMAKARFVPMIPVLASYGCPYACEFCSDARVDYHPLPLSDVEDDVRFAAEQYPGALLVWTDPNFGVGFDSLMDAIDRALEGRRVRFGAQSSLSLLSRERLARLERAAFVLVVPGLESWFSCDMKLGGIGRHKGLDRVCESAALVRDVLSFIPYVQVNFVFGLDNDPVSENYELSAEFVRRVPAAWPTFNLVTAWGLASPLSEKLHAEGRVLPIPFPLLDQKACSNVIRADGSTVELYRGLVRLEEMAFGAALSWARARAARRWGGRVINLIRGLGSEMRERIRWHRRMQRWLETDREFRAFFEGARVPLPAVIRDRALASLGPFAGMLPNDVIDELRVGRVLATRPA
jgi:hypothetical protein